MYLGDLLILDYSPNSKTFTCPVSSWFLRPCYSWTFPDSLYFVLCRHQTSRDNSPERFVSQQTLHRRLMAIKDTGILSLLHMGWGRGDGQKGRDTKITQGYCTTSCPRPVPAVRWTPARHLLEMCIYCGGQRGRNLDSAVLWGKKKKLLPFCYIIRHQNTEKQP